MPRRNEHRDRIAAALARLRQAVIARPGFGRGSARSTAILGDGVNSVSVEQSWTITCDLPTSLGGDRSAPSPSQLVRAALGNCLAMSYQLRAAELGVELTSVKVTVETDDEVGGMLIPQDVSPGFTAVRYHVDIESPDDRGAVRALVDAAERLSPVLADLTRPLTVERSRVDRRPARQAVS